MYSVPLLQPVRAILAHQRAEDVTLGTRCVSTGINFFAPPALMFLTSWKPASNAMSPAHGFRTTAKRMDAPSAKTGDKSRQYFRKATVISPV